MRIQAICNFTQGWKISQTQISQQVQIGQMNLQHWPKKASGFESASYITRLSRTDNENEQKRR